MNPKDQINSSNENIKQSISPEPSSSSSETTNNASISSTVTRQWGEERVVFLNREDDKGLGISIVGGKVEMFNTSAGSAVSGIFIKNILSDSPAGREATLKSGDRLLEVDGVNVRDATHDKAVDAIKNAKNPIKFVVQSLLPLVSINRIVIHCNTMIKLLSSERLPSELRAYLKPNRNIIGLECHSGRCRVSP